MVLTIMFKGVTIVDHNLQLRRVAEDICMQTMKHEGASRRFVGRPCTDSKVLLFFSDIKEER